MVPLSLTVACLMGLAQLRPARTALAGSVALSLGFGAGLAVMNPGEEGMAGPSSFAADVGAASVAPSLAELAPAPEVPEIRRLPSEPGARAEIFDRVVQVGKGDTLMKLLIEAGVDRADAYGAIEALRDVYDPRHLRVGQEITLTYAAAGQNPASLAGLRLTAARDREAGAGRLVDGRFEAFEIEKQLALTVARAGGSIRSSLFEDGAVQGVPARVMVDFIRLFSFDIDFQRDIHAGDGFDILFERYVENEGGSAYSGNIRYASLTVGGRTHRLYRFETEDGDVDFFDENGESARKALLRTPIDGARLSSRFGMRKHPILGYSRMHQGIDFAAATGTPIMAAGSGVVEFIGRKGGYGKYIRIRHNNEYSTAYAHMNGYAKGLTRGKRVKQGEVIGYVGTTGRSTGPHLHYEVLHKGTQINPMNLKLPSGIKLAGKDLQRFKAMVKATKEKLDTMPRSTLLARATTQ